MDTSDLTLNLRAYLEAAIGRGLHADIGLIVLAITGECERLATELSGGDLRCNPGQIPRAHVANPSGDLQHPLDIAAHDGFVEALTHAPVQWVLSEEANEPITIDPQASFAVAIDPLDGSNNIAINAPVGSIFSILRGISGDEPSAAFLSSGRQVCAAGVVMYGPATVMALSVGDGTDLFVLDPTTGDFLRSHSKLLVPSGTREFAINASNYRHWDPRLRVYIDDLVAGTEGPRGEDFNMRWIAALVADAYRILRRGGIYLYPSDARVGYANGRLRLIYEAQPVAFLIEQSGGAAIDMTGPILDRQPREFHERCPLIFGSCDKVDRVADYLVSPRFTGHQSPLFAQRGLFRS